MAHSKAKKDELRRRYVFDGLSLAIASETVGVAYGTAQRWKNTAKTEGDDWDAVRAAHTLAGGELEDIGRQILTDFVVQFKATMDLLKESPELHARERVELLTSLADSYNKAISANKKILPETSKLAVALQVVEMLSKYISEHKPELLAVFMEVLLPFGQILEKELSNKAGK